MVMVSSMFMIILTSAVRLCASSRILDLGNRPTDLQMGTFASSNEDLQPPSPTELHMESPLPDDEASAAEAMVAPGSPYVSSMAEVGGLLVERLQSGNEYVFVGGCHYQDVLKTGNRDPCDNGLGCGFEHSSGVDWEACASDCSRLRICKGFSFQYNLADAGRFGSCSICARLFPEERQNSGVWKKEQDARQLLPKPPTADQVKTTVVQQPATKRQWRKSATQPPPGNQSPPKSPVTKYSGADSVRTAPKSPVTKYSGAVSVRTVPHRQPATQSGSKTRVVFCEAKWQCSPEQQWFIGEEMLRKGSYGQVWPAMTREEKMLGQDQNEPNFVIKYPVSYSAKESPIWREKECKDISTEAKLMRQIQASFASKPQCQHAVMQAIDDHPCWETSGDNASFTPVPGAYVMRYMDGDLDLYRKQYKLAVPKCIAKITQMAMNAIQCFHESNWVHADIKLPNILWKGLDKDNCPEEIRLADFGLAAKEGTKERSMFSYSNYDKCWYLPSDMFYIPPHKRTNSSVYSLGLADLHERKFQHGFGLDWCAFHFSWSRYFSQHRIPNPHWSGNCGYMGHGRLQAFIVEPAIAG